jgi:hypothetical protein
MAERSEQAEQDGGPAEFHPAVNAEDLLHPYQDVEREDLGELQEELGQSQERAARLQHDLELGERTRVEPAAAAERARAKLEELSREIDRGLSEEVTDRAQALIDAAQKKLNDFQAEKPQPDAELAQKVAAAQEKLDLWNAKMRFLGHPDRVEFIEWRNRRGAAEKPGFVAQAIPEEPDEPEGITKSDRQAYERDKGEATKNQYDESLRAASGRLRDSERRRQDSREATITRLKEDLSRAHTEASRLKRAEEDRMRANKRRLQDNVSDADHRLFAHDSRARDRRMELENVQARIQRLQARLQVTEAHADQPRVEQPGAAPEAELSPEEGDKS